MTEFSHDQAARGFGNFADNFFEYRRQMDRARFAAMSVWGGGDPYIERTIDWDIQVIVAAHLHSGGDVVTFAEMIESGWRPDDKDFKLVDHLTARIQRNDRREKEFSRAKFSDDPNALPDYLNNQISKMTMGRLFR